MMKTKVFTIASIYVPVKRRATLDAGKGQAIAESVMEVGQKAPILVRQDGKPEVGRFQAPASPSSMASYRTS